MMSFTQAIRVCLREKFATFSGRASRSEYWWFWLFSVLVYIVANILDTVVFGAVIFTAIVSLTLLIPGFAVLFRRLHDRNLPGWLVFAPIILAILAMLLGEKSDIILMIGMIGAIGVTMYTFVMIILKGDSGTNNYGPDPLNPHSNSSIF